MTNTLRTLVSALISILYLGPATMFSGPIPQGNPQGAPPPNRPAQAQVVLAPAPIQAGKLPPKEERTFRQTEDYSR